MPITTAVRSAPTAAAARPVPARPVQARPVPARPAAARPGVPSARTGLVRLRRVPTEDTRRRELNDRDLEVLELVASGGTRDEISRALGIAPGTVASRMARIYRALGARNAPHAVALAHGCGVMSECPAPPALRLSRRERQVLAGLAHGLTSEQMAEHLSVSHETVKTHLQRAYRKLGVSCRANAVDKAIRGRLLAVVVDTDGTAARRGLGVATAR